MTVRPLGTNAHNTEGTDSYQEDADNFDNGRNDVRMEEDHTSTSRASSSLWASNIIRGNHNNNNDHDDDDDNHKIATSSTARLIMTALPPPPPSAPSESDLWRATRDEEPAAGASKRDVRLSLWRKDAPEILPPPPPLAAAALPPRQVVVQPSSVVPSPVLYDYQRDWIVYTTPTADTATEALTTAAAGSSSLDGRPPPRPDDYHTRVASNDQTRSPASAELEQRFEYIDSLLNEHLANFSPVRRKERVPVVGVPVYPHHARPVLPTPQPLQQYDQHQQQNQQQLVTNRIPREPPSTTPYSSNGNGNDIVLGTSSFLRTAPNDNHKRYGSLEETHGYSTIWASGVAGAVVGTLVLGTIPGLIAGFYAAYVHGDEGAAGDISRALGEVAIVIRHKALMIEARHHIMDKAQWVLEQAFLMAMELNRRHEIVNKMKKFVQFAWTMTLDYLCNRGREIQWNVDDQRSRLRQPVPTNMVTIVPPEYQHDRRNTRGTRRLD